MPFHHVTGHLIAILDLFVKKCLVLESFRLISLKFFHEARSSQALEGIYSTVVLRDILQRNHQADQNMLQKITLFLCSNIGSITSPNSIGNVLSSQGDIQSGRNVAGKTVEKYIAMLRSAFVFYSVSASCGLCA